MSWKYFDGSGGIESCPETIRYLEKIGVLGVLGADKINLAIKKSFQVPHQIEKTIGVVGTFLVVEFVEEVDVAGGGVEFAAGGGAEKFEFFDAVFAAKGFDLGAMLFD